MNPLLYSEKGIIIGEKTGDFLGPQIQYYMRNNECIIGLVLICAVIVISVLTFIKLNKK